MANRPHRESKKSGCKEWGVLTWFLLCGFIHIFIEGWFVLFWPRIKDGALNFWVTAPSAHVPANAASMDGLTLGWETYQNFMASMWREYAHADYRYALGDSFVLSMEAITAVFDGFGSFALVYAILNNAPWRHPLQIMVSLAQLYGDVLYFGTEYLDNFSHVDMSDPLYYGVYFTFLNGLWIVIPTLLIIQSFRALTRAMCSSAHQKTE